MPPAQPIILIALPPDLENLGIKFIHYSLLRAGYDSSLMYAPHFTADSSADTIIDYIRRTAPLFVGISLMSDEFARAVHLTGLIRAAMPGLPIVWGGVHPTIAPEECAEVADYVCVGEGEAVVLDVAARLGAGLRPDDVANIALKGADGRLIVNPNRPIVADLDEVPSYDHRPRASVLATASAVVPLDRETFRRNIRYKGRIYSVMGSRGCPYSCSYCCNNILNKMNGSSKVRFRSPENIIDEIVRSKTNEDYINMIKFHDDCFLARPLETLQAFAALYKEKVGLPFAINSIPGYITGPKLDALKAAGLTAINVGMQSGSERVLKEVYRRKSPPEQVARAIGLLAERKIAAWVDIIVDNPLESEDEKLATVEAIANIPRPFYLQMYSLTPYFGTDLQKMLGDAAADTGKTKNYLQLEADTINSMVIISPFLSRNQVLRLVALYRQGRQEPAFRVAFVVMKAYALARIPFVFANIFIRLNGNSLWTAAGALSSFAGFALRRWGQNLGFSRA